MRQIIKNNQGELEIDPYGRKRDFEMWLKKIGYFEGKISYVSFTDISPIGSELATRYALDLFHGKNTAKGSGRGTRSFNHLYNIMTRLPRIIKYAENYLKKDLVDFTDDDILQFFNAMRQGTFKTIKGTAFLSISTYSKMFCAFWRWMVRTQPIADKEIKSIVEHVDTSDETKPKWHHFTLKDVELMAELTNNLYYKALLYFLFDSGIRAPKELVNVRVKDLTPVPESPYLFLQIREETSKTFGRKIKLMICSDILKKYIGHAQLKPDDFLFYKGYPVMTRMVAYLGYKTLKLGTVRQQKTNKVLVTNGITMYDFRHNSVCYYLPIYHSENQMKYRYGWTNAAMIQYYSEFIGMRDTITDEDMILDSNKPQLMIELEKEKQKVAMMHERYKAREEELETRMQKMEAMMLQRFADNF